MSTRNWKTIYKEDIYLKMDKIANDIQYEKWYPYFYKDLRYMFNILLKSLDFYNKDKKEEYFSIFCTIIFNRSSKRIPKY